MRKKLLIVILPLLITACATIGINMPETTEQKINMSAATLTGLTNTVSNDLASGYITSEQAEKFYDEAVKVREGIRTSRLLLTASADGEALEKWLAINNILIELNATYGGER